MPNLYRKLALSNHPAARAARRLYWGFQRFTLPAPKVVVKPMLWSFLAVRAVYYWLMRVFICEPLFKAYCASYGRNVHTGVYIHYIQGQGELIVGDDVLVDGKCTFGFAARFSDRPTLTIGDHSGIGHGCGFTVAKRITIGRHCRIGGGVLMFDASGHPSDPSGRLAKLPPSPDEVRPITLEDNVWIGGRCTIFPGVTIGEGSVVSAGSVVTADVPPYTLVAGNPARRVRALEPSSRP